ncbi:MAG: hypothetical protein M1824_000321 [Vezdaea acicularis]|nr:MAG: hypothetical protein M1824_000321 [Vezdaea acicularis]
MTSATIATMRPTLRITIPARATYTTETTIRPFLRLRIFGPRELPPHEQFPYWCSVDSESEWDWRDHFLLSPMVALTASPTYFRYNWEYPRWRPPQSPRSEEGDWAQSSELAADPAAEQTVNDFSFATNLAAELAAAQLDNADSPSYYEGEGHARTESSRSDRACWSGRLGGMPVSRIYADLVRRGDIEGEDENEEEVEGGSAGAATEPEDEAKDSGVGEEDAEEIEGKGEDGELLPYPGQDGEYPSTMTS